MTEAKSLLKVFLCCAASDKPKVHELYRFLKAHNIQPWFDDEDLLPGQNRQLETAKVIGKSEAIIICLSTGSVGKEGHIHKEIKFALDRAMEMPEGRIFIIPAKLDKCELPYSLREYSSVDLFAAGGYEKLMKAFATRVQTSEVEPTDIEPSSTAHQQAAERSIQVGENARENIFITGDHTNLQMGERSRPILNLRRIKTDLANQTLDEINCILHQAGVVFTDRLRQDQVSGGFLYSFSLKNIGERAAINILPKLITPKRITYKGEVLASLSPNEAVILRFIVDLQNITIPSQYFLLIEYNGSQKVYEQEYFITLQYLDENDYDGFELNLNGNIIHTE